MEGPAPGGGTAVAPAPRLLVAIFSRRIATMPKRRTLARTVLRPAGATLLFATQHTAARQQRPESDDQDGKAVFPGGVLDGATDGRSF